MYVVKSAFQQQEGIDDKTMAIFFSVGYFFSMFGKASAGAMSDSYGGYLVVMLAVVGYIVPTVLFSFVPAGPTAIYWYFVLWALIGYAGLGLSWVAVVAVATNWIPATHLGRLMSFMSMSPQLGDVLARLVLAVFLSYGWRNVFRIAALCAFGLWLPVVIFVRNAPPEIEHEDGNTAAAHSEVTVKKVEEPYFQRLRPLLKLPLFWAICLLSGSLYGTRTLFLLYSNNFLAASYCREQHPFGDADTLRDCTSSDTTASVTAVASSIYTLLGCVSVFIIGVLKDLLPMHHRATTLVIFILPLVAAMGFLGIMGTSIPFAVAVSLVALTGFCLFGPYKVLGAVFAVDIGGKKLKSTCTAFFGVFDNFFAILMLQCKGVIGDDWQLMFMCVTGLSTMSLLCATYVWFGDLKASRAQARTLAEPLVLGPRCE